MQYSFVQHNLMRSTEQKLILLSVLAIIMTINFISGISVLNYFNIKITKAYAFVFLALIVLMVLSRLIHDFAQSYSWLLAMHVKLRFLLVSPLFLPLLVFSCFLYRKASNLQSISSS